MTRIDKLCVFYFFAIYIWYDAVVFKEIISVYLSSGLYHDIQSSIPFLGLGFARAGLTVIAIVMYFKGLRFDLYMWVMNLIIVATYSNNISVYFNGDNSIISESSTFGPGQFLISIFFLSACASAIYLIVRIRIFNQLPLFEESDRPF